MPMKPRIEKSIIATGKSMRTPITPTIKKRNT